MQRMIRTPFRLFVGLLALATLALLTLSAWNFRTSNLGSSAEYWEYMCGVQLPGFQGHHRNSRVGGTYPVVEGRAYYYAQTHHEQILYSLPVHEVLEDTPLVRSVLASPKSPDPSECGVHPKSACDYFIDGAEKRSECDKRSNVIDSDTFDVEKLETLRTDLARYSPFSSTADNRAQVFLERLSRGKRAWITVLLEGLFLWAWLWFVVGASPFGIHWRWRAAFSPFLLFIPYFFGYAPMTFTSGPSGGFVYPVYLMLASLPMNVIPCSSLDAIVWEYMPNVLNTFSQLPGSPLAASGYACVGPASSLVFGVVVVVSVSIFGLVVKKVRH